MTRWQDTSRSNPWPCECQPLMKCTPQQQCWTQSWSYHGTFSVLRRGSNLGPLGWQPSTLTTWGTYVSWGLYSQVPRLTWKSSGSGYLTWGCRYIPTRYIPNQYEHESALLILIFKGQLSWVSQFLLSNVFVICVCESLHWWQKRKHNSWTSLPLLSFQAPSQRGKQI